MKPKKTTAPSDSQRDSQDLDWEKEFDKRFSQTIEGGRYLINDPLELKKFIQQKLDKFYQAGFQEAVERITEAVEKAGDLSMLGSASGSAMKSSMLIFLNTLKPTQSQGLEGKVEKLGCGCLLRTCTCDPQRYWTPIECKDCPARKKRPVK